MWSLTYGLGFVPSLRDPYNLIQPGTDVPG